MRSIGIFGCTFDPIHYGHLRTALELKSLLDLAKVHIVPCADPPHRTAPMSDGALRLRMVEAAIRNEPGFVADDRELKRAGVSYTIDTLASFRAELPGRSLCLLLGMDAFLGLPQWRRWRELTTLAHIVVAHRPGWEVPTTGTLGELLRDLRAPSVAELHSKAAGLIHVQPVTQLEISSTDLRDSLRAGPSHHAPSPTRARRFLAPVAE